MKLVDIRQKKIMRRVDPCVYTEEYYSTAYHNGTLWAGTGDGLAKTTNNGISWKIYRTYPVPGDKNKLYSYPYPNPFSPTRFNRIGEDGNVRIQYNTLKDTEISIYVYNFAMKLVKTVVKNKFRAGGSDYSEVWNGKDDYGRKVANGTYFYKLVQKGEKTLYGKIVIID